MRKYRLVAKKGEGTFSEVLKAQNIKDGKYHAIKCMKNRFDSIDQVNNLREIQALRRLSPHHHIITLEEVLYDQPTGRLALVFELMDANLYELIRGRRHYLNATLIKSYMYQLLKSLDHMHRKGIFHRDIKPENILIESTGELGQGLKLADFGSCRGIYSKQPYTEYISTRWYRAPECLLTDGYYGPEMDLWGAGCVFFEITSLYPLFPGTNEIDQVARIHKVLGTPEAEVLAKFKAHGAAHVNFDFPYQKGIGIAQLIPHASPDCIDLMMKLLKYDATDRITAREALRHVYFKEMRENDMRRQAAQRVPGAMAAAASQAPETSTSTMNKNESSSSSTTTTTTTKLGHSLGSDHGLKLSNTTSTTQQQQQPASLSSTSVGGGGHHHGGHSQSKGLPTIGGISSSTTGRKESLPRNTMPQASLSRYSNNHTLKNNSSTNPGDSKSGLPPIIGAVLGNSNRSSKLSHGVSGSTNDHKNSSRLHEAKKAVKRKSKARLFETSSHRYQGQQGLAPGQGVLVASGTKVRKSGTFHVGELINA